jgi:hypothetical protein
VHEHGGDIIVWVSPYFPLPPQLSQFSANHLEYQLSATLLSEFLNKRAAISPTN